MIDFKLIRTGEDFELFCEDLLRSKGLSIARRPSRGPDSGADIIASTSGKDILGFDQESRILVECKHYAISGRSVREADVGSIIERTIANNCNKYLLITSTLPSVSLAKQIEAISSNPSIQIKATCWSKNDLEKFIETNIELFNRYFIPSIKFASKSESEDEQAHIIAVHLHPDFSSELQELIESWNSKQQHIAFIPIRPPREIEARLLSKEEMKTNKAETIAQTIRAEAGFSEQDGIIIFCEGRLFDEVYAHLFSDTFPSNRNELDLSIISLEMKRRLVLKEEPQPECFAMVIQSILYALGVSAGLSKHDVTRTCIMDFNNIMSDILLGLRHGPRFCPKCRQLLQLNHKDYLLNLAEVAKNYVHQEKVTSIVSTRRQIRKQRKGGEEKQDYDVALSFAGEDRKHAAALATVLKKMGVNAFYDDFEKDKLWGEDLYTYLDELYRFRARFCIMFLSKNYAAKLWTNHERESAQSRSLGHK